MSIDRKKMLRTLKIIFRNLSIGVNMTLNGIYLLFLLILIIAGLGVQWINITLMILTGAFMLIYLLLRLSNKNTTRKIRYLKESYKVIKITAKIVTLITTIYTLFTAFNYVHPLLFILALLGITFLMIRLLVEIIFNLIKRKVESIKDEISYRIKKRRLRKVEMEDADVYPEPTVEVIPKKTARKKSEKKKLDDIVIPIEESVLSDVEDL